MKSSGTAARVTRARATRTHSTSSRSQKTSRTPQRPAAESHSKHAANAITSRLGNPTGSTGALRGIRVVSSTGDPVDDDDGPVGSALARTMLVARAVHLDRRPGARRMLQLPKPRSRRFAATTLAAPMCPWQYQRPSTCATPSAGAAAGTLGAAHSFDAALA